MQSVHYVLRMTVGGPPIWTVSLTNYKIVLVGNHKRNQSIIALPLFLLLFVFFLVCLVHFTTNVTFLETTQMDIFAFIYAILTLYL